MNAEDAFINSKERNVFVETAPATQLLDSIEQGLGHQSPIIVLTGEAGLGKSTVMREAAARWASRVHVAWLDAGRVPVDALFGQTIRRFGGHFRATDQRPEQVGRFAAALNSIKARELTPVLVVDDAHELDLVALAELGRIESAAAATNVPFKLVLIGRPELLERLTDEALQPLEARVGVRGTIDAMALADTREYLAHRVEAAGGDSAQGFSKKAAREIHTASAGVPTVVNALSDEAQRCANAAGTAMVGPEHVRAVIAAAFRADAAPGIAPGMVQAVSDHDEEDGVVEDAAPKSGSHKKPKKADAKSVIPEKPKVIASHKAPATPPSAAARVPPPPTKRPAAPLPKMSELDSSSPRVRDWVSRFTEGQPPVRFGGRIAPPSASGTSKAFDPDLVPLAPDEPITFQSVADELKAALEPVEAKATPEPVESEVESVEDAPVEAVAENEPVAEEVVEEMAESEEVDADVAEAAAESAAEVESDEAANAEAAAKALAEPVPTASKLQLVGLSPDESKASSAPPAVAIEVKPEQLASPPLEVDEAPAPWTPEPPPREPIPPSADDDLHVPSLTAENVEKLAPQVEKTVAETAASTEPVAEAPVEEEFVDRRRSATRPFGAAEAKVGAAEPEVSAKVPPPSVPFVEPDEEDDEVDAPLSVAGDASSSGTERGATPAASQSGTGSRSRKKQRALARRAERAARRAAEAAARAEKASARVNEVAAQGSHVDPTPVAKPAPTPIVAKPAPPVRAQEAPPPATAPQRGHIALERFSDGPRSPRHARLLTGVITGLIMLGMAIMAIWLGRRGGFDAAPETTPVTTASEPHVQEPAPAPTASVTPPAPESDTTPLAVTPQSGGDTPATTTAPTSEAASPGETAAATEAEYCLAVGSYLFEDRARDLARTLTRRTGQPARVIAEGRGSEKSYRILYGAYDTEDAATRAADKLLARGIVTEALVERLPQQQ